MWPLLIIGCASLASPIACDSLRVRLGLSLESRRCYERALDLDPRNADAWVARGAAFANQQQLGRAAEDFSMALGALPLHNTVYRDFATDRAYSSH